MEICEALRGAVPFDAFCWPLTDPGTLTPGLTVADLPFWTDMPRFVHLRHGCSNVNRPSVLAASRSRAASLHAATGGDLSRSLHWRESLRPHGIRDELTAAYSDPYGCWGFVELYREHERFDADDVEFLGGLVPAITAALRIAQARRYLAARPTSSTPDGPAVLVLNADLRLVSRTPAAAEWLRILRPVHSYEPEVPGYVYGLAGRLDAIDAGLETLPPRLRTQAPDGTAVTLQAARLEGRHGHYAITIQQTSATERMGLLGRAVGLSSRQQELLALLAAGLTTRELAQRLHLSEHTVQEHYKAIFTKTGVNSRRELVSRAIDVTESPRPPLH